ncbi:MAG: hypothetical protein K9K21_11215, partial [Desulfotignum sp.]|nr:hypothetical protein [Desulfotignum sp.]
GFRIGKIQTAAFQAHLFLSECVSTDLSFTGDRLKNQWLIHPAVIGVCLTGKKKTPPIFFSIVLKKLLTKQIIWW